MPSSHRILHRSTLNLPQTPTVILPLTRKEPPTSPTSSRSVPRTAPDQSYRAHPPSIAIPGTVPGTPHFTNPILLRTPPSARHVVSGPYPPPSPFPAPCPDSASPSQDQHVARPLLPSLPSSVRYMPPGGLSLRGYCVYPRQRRASPRTPPPRSTRLHIIAGAKHGPNTDKASLGSSVPCGGASSPVRRLPPPPCDRPRPCLRPGSGKAPSHCWSAGRRVRRTCLRSPRHSPTWTTGDSRRASWLEPSCWYPTRLVVAPVCWQELNVGHRVPCLHEELHAKSETSCRSCHR